ncbi:MAG: putative rane transport protein [Chlamydiales bacterium]|jgi:DASS family divalent anion:Na+ symporter|nr:putative rane transport protein [Chlamydiales bacterium]
MNNQLHLKAFLFSVAIGALIWFLPTPAGLPEQGQQLFAIFLATIIAIIGQALPMGAAALIGLTSSVLLQVTPIDTALACFGKDISWRVVLAFFIARGFIKTGLGARVAYIFVRLIGRKTLGLCYGLMSTELLLAPAIPSMTARSGAIIFPILKSLSESFGSFPHDGTNRKIGHFLTLALFQASAISSAMFMTAMAANPLIVGLALESGVSISWGTWALAAIVPGLISFITIPLIIYKLYPPELKETPNAKEFASEKLRLMGPISLKEWAMIGTFWMLLILWTAGESFGVHPTAAALLGLSILLLTSVLTWEDVRKEDGAWDTLIWFSVLICLATELNRSGFIFWISELATHAFSGLSWPIAFVMLSLLYFYSHYLFASSTAHVSSMFSVILVVAISLGTPPTLAALAFAFISNLFGGLTHYSSGTAPILFGSGYVDIKAWWKVGLVSSVANLAIWLGIGSIWWKFLGYW